MGDLTPAIQVEKLSFAYDGRPILNEISLEIPAGQFTVLLGKNGSGKSTLMRILGGFLEFERGAVQIMGEEIRSFSSRRRARILGYLPQHHRPIFPFSVQDVVLTGRASYVSYVPKQEDVEIGIAALERVGIIHLKDRPYTELSGGEQQLVRIARVLGPTTPSHPPRRTKLTPRLPQPSAPAAPNPRVSRCRPHGPRRPARPQQRLPVWGPLHFSQGWCSGAATSGRAAVGPRFSGADLRHGNGFNPLRRPRPRSAEGVSVSFHRRYLTQLAGT